LAISALFAILLVSGLAVAQRFQQGACDSILVASSNEKSDLMKALAADFSATARKAARSTAAVRKTAAHLR
jgi:hypothetical protein